MNPSSSTSGLRHRPISLRWLFLAMIGMLTLIALPANAQAPVLAPYAPDNGIVGQKIDHQLGYFGTATRFSASGLPSGLALNTTTGRLTGQFNVAGTSRIVIYAWNGTARSAPLIIDWTVDPLPAGTVGTYYALLDYHPWYNGDYGGSLRITVTSTGAYTGYITRGIHRNNISGRLETMPGDVEPFGTFLVPRRQPYEPLKVDFELPRGDNSINGRLEEPGGDVIFLDGHKTYTSAGGNPSDYVGRWNTAYELPGEPEGSATYPQGATWATQTISRAGIVTWVSRLADGTSNTFSTDLLTGGLTLAHLMLYNYGGSVHGWQHFNVEEGTTTAGLGWIKSTNYTRSYSAGFPLHYLYGNGARYTPPALGQMIFGITPGTDNARFIFSEGGLGSPYSQLFSIGTGNVVKFPTGASNPYGIKATFSFATGIVTGTGTAMDFIGNQPANSRAGTFSGLLIPGREQAVGHFLLPASRASNSQILSGKLIGEENFESQ